MSRYFDLIKDSDDVKADGGPRNYACPKVNFDSLNADTLQLSPLDDGWHKPKTAKRVGVPARVKPPKAAFEPKAKPDERSEQKRSSRNGKQDKRQRKANKDNASGQPSKRTSKKRKNRDERPLARSNDFTKDGVPEEKPRQTDEPENRIQREPISTQTDQSPVKASGKQLEDESSWLRAAPIDEEAVRTRVYRDRIGRRNQQLESLNKFCSKASLLNVEERGFCAVDLNDDDSLVKSSTEITQRDIRSSADLLTRSKQFDLHLDKFGPYSVDYSRNGRHLLLYGDKGHIAAVDWQTKKLHFEINVMEKIRHARWLHNESFLAVAQNRWTYVYDQRGVEIHCLKKIDKAFQLEFLPYHFILVSLNVSGFLNYLDVSTGVCVANYPSWKTAGRPTAMTKCPSNAVTLTAHSTGSVQFWSPSVQEPLVTLFAHRSPVRTLLTDTRGSVLATVGADRKVKLWDLRTYKLMATHGLPGVPSSIAFSQTGLFATCFDKQIKVFSNFCNREQQSAELYMEHIAPAKIGGCQFCPFEDVLGVGHQNGFSSLIIPGSGEANFDGYETNPYETYRQKRNAEVRALLEKIPYEMISLDNSVLTQVNVQEALNNVDPAAEPQKRPKVMIRKTKRGKRVKIGMQLLAKKKVRAMMIREMERSMRPVEKEKKKTRKDFMAEDPIFGRFKTTK